MTISIIPLQQIANQQVGITLGNQQCVININTYDDITKRQYFSLSNNGVVVCRTVLMVYATTIVNAAYTGFIGDFAVIDLMGEEPPQYTGWGARWLLAYNDAA